MFSWLVPVAHLLGHHAWPRVRISGSQFSLSPAALGCPAPTQAPLPFSRLTDTRALQSHKSAHRINEMCFSCAASGKILKLNLCVKQRWFADSWMAPPVWRGFPSMPRILPGIQFLSFSPEKLTQNNLFLFVFLRNYRISLVELWLYEYFPL